MTVQGYTTKEAAEKVGVSVSRIRQLAGAGEIDHGYHGKSLVITEQGIEDAKNRKTKRGPAPVKKEKNQ